MWKEDFVEKKSEKRALSKEDHLFLDEMKKGIDFSEGHYVLPLPLRKKAGAPTEGRIKVEPVKEKLQGRFHDNSAHQSHEARSEDTRQPNEEHQPPGKDCAMRVKIVSPEEVGVGRFTESRAGKKARRS